MDCFAPLAMTAQRLIVCGCLKLGSRHCEERSDEAIHLSLRGEMDCFASLAMTAQHLDCLWLFEIRKPSLRGAKRRSNPSFFTRRDGLLRFARNDGSTPGSSVAV